MTSIPKDKEELRKNIRCTLGYCEVSEHGNCLFESSRNATQELDLIMQLVEAHKEQAVLEAGIQLGLRAILVDGENKYTAKKSDLVGTAVAASLNALVDRQTTYLATLRSKGGSDE